MDNLFKLMYQELNEAGKKMTRAWYYNTTSGYIRIYEVEYLGKTTSGLSIVQFKKKVIDSYMFLITIGSKSSMTSSLIYHKRLDVAKAVIKDIFLRPEVRWIL